ncbi:MAG: hypothetical protein ACI9ZD_002808, partial [Paracoccaceae bacterium]
AIYSPRSGPASLRKSEFSSHLIHGDGKPIKLVY